MEEVDKILIHSLRQAGTSVPPEVQSVRDLSPELVVAAAVRCLRAVSPALGNALSPALPPGISARFRLASELAAACQELGFGGDVGYQTFLYSSEHDVRRLLLFLVEKLPRDEGHRGAETPGKSGLLLGAVGARIRELLGTPWVPPPCRTPKLQRLQGTRHLRPFLTCALVLPRTGGAPDVQEYFGGAAPPVPAQPPRPCVTPPALLEAHGAQLGTPSEGGSDWGGPRPGPQVRPPDGGGDGRPRARLRALEFLRQAWPPRAQGPPPGPPQGPPLDPSWLLEAFGAGGSGGALPKGSRFTRTQQLTQQQVSLARLEAEIEQSRGRIRGAELGLAQAEAELRHFRGALGGREDALGGRFWGAPRPRRSWCSFGGPWGGREDALRIKARALELLPDAQNNLGKLQLVVESSSRRIVSLAGQWERHREPLLAQYRELRALRDSAQRESSRRLAETRALLQRSRAAAEEARRKETLHGQLGCRKETLHGQLVGLGAHRGL
ncbi:LOW QUALITY PROTEIN: coiled-coil domain-containing protein 22 [Ammospiza caudacuta]|uniref:LOW QUALITY PROTEIN: coiled-coil domain-containing protein 22 n=1 Tax=Ammospiza caudacuta TaxID=2857398 RepID=UPI002739D074|nr:LOW QUALITY PROTEIN: coiled-coil domain-containing protein 22 [Ammospiza caudacuta]